MANDDAVEYQNGVLYYSHDPAKIRLADGSPVHRFAEMFGLVDETGRMREGVVNAGEPYSLSRGALRSRGVDGRRNLYFDCGFPDVITADMYQRMYERNPVAARVVECVPKESWQVQPTVFEDADPEVVTEFEQAVDDLGKGLCPTRSFYQDEKGSVVWQYLLRADILSRIGQYGVIFLGLDDGLDPSWPVDGFEEWNSVPEDSPETRARTLKGYVDDMGLTPDEAKRKLKELKEAEDRTRTARAMTGGSIRWTSPARNANPALVTVNAVSSADPRSKPTAVVKDRSRAKFDPRADGQQDATGAYALKTPKQTAGGKAPKRRLLYLRVFGEVNAAITQFEDNRSSPRFGQPTMYQLTMNQRDSSGGGSTGGVGLPTTTMDVHWTRVIHVTDAKGESEVFHVPAMRTPFNNLLNVEKTLAGAGEGYWQACIPTTVWFTNPQMGGNVSVNETRFKNMIENVRHGGSRDVLLKGMQGMQLAPSPIDPTPFVDADKKVICNYIGVPMRVFDGSERGELASSQDDGSWNDELRRVQLVHNTPDLVVPLFDRLILCGVLPEPKPRKVEVDDDGAVTEGDAEPVDEGEEVDAETPSAPTAAKSKKADPEADAPVGNRVYRVERTVRFLTRNAETGEEEVKVGKRGSTVVETAAGYSVEWPDLESQTKGERATVIGTLTSALSAYAGPGAAPTVMPPRDYFTKVWEMDEEDVDLMIEAAEEAKVKAQEDAMQQQADMIDRGLAPDPTAPPPGPGGKQSEEEDPNADPFQPAKPKPSGPPVGNVFCPTGEGGGVDPACKLVRSRENAPKNFLEAFDRFKAVSQELFGKDGGGNGFVHAGDVNDRYLTAHLKTHFLSDKEGELREVYAVRIDFAKGGEKALESKMGPGAVTQLRLVKKAVEAYSKAGFGIEAEPADEDRRRVYANVLKKFDLSPVGGRAKHVWNEFVANVFCATGAGGGIDPTCGEGGGEAKGDAAGGAGKAAAGAKGGDGKADSGNESAKASYTLVRQRGNTHEGVPEATAKTMTAKPDLHRALEWQENMTVVRGSNGPNRSLPNETRPQLNELERGALQKYSYKNDAPMNQLLRGTAEVTKDGTVLYTDREGNRSTTPYRKEYYDEMKTQMDSAFAKAPVLKTPIKVVRGMNLSDENLQKFVGGLEASMKSGEPHPINGYISTSTPKGMMAQLGLAPGVGKPFRGNVTMKINAVHGLDMKPHTQLTAEGEFLLPQGSKFTVKSIVKKADGYHVELDQHPPEKRATQNVFCATGEGGGVDPTCGKGGDVHPDWRGDIQHVTAHHNEESIRATGFRTGGGTFGHGVYFSLDGNKRAATGTNDSGAVTIKATARVKNPLTLDFTKPADQWDADPSYQKWLSAGADVKGDEGRKALLAMGHDAVRVKFGTTEYRIVLDPSLIDIHRPEQKKATQNVFCPTGPGGGVDPSCGKGQTLYHGSQHEFDEFNATSKSSNSTTFGDVSVERHGVFLTGSKDFASLYGKVKEYDVDVKNPVTVTRDTILDFADTLDAFGPDRDLWIRAKNERKVWAMFDNEVGKRFVAYLKEQGYDAAQFYEDHETEDGESVEGKTTVVFDPKKIKRRK